jgi:hypothetical protein
MIEPRLVIRIQHHGHWVTVATILERDLETSVVAPGQRCPTCRETILDDDVTPVPLCVCAHPIAAHQTGEGPWTGFCGDLDCECESPVAED